MINELIDKLMNEEENKAKAAAQGAVDALTNMKKTRKGKEIIPLLYNLILNVSKLHDETQKEGFIDTDIYATLGGKTKRGTADLKKRAQKEVTSIQKYVDDAAQDILKKIREIE